jgi:hypothetical protein
MGTKKLSILALIIGFVIALSAFMPVKKQEDIKYKNLKVLPKNISKVELDKVMDDFKIALGVKCGHCHAPSKDNPRKMDFASDEKQEKITAREMMKMTVKINKKYFGKNIHEGKLINSISCVTCHNGKTEPSK